jgi:cytochrome c biogenesis protein CcmG, thiol:disulfide interchange protein DsbE
MMSNGISFWRLLSLTLVTLVLTFFCACNSNENLSNSNAPVISSPPPTALPMPPLNGKSIEKMGWVLANGTHTSFGEFKGKVLILDFYATWCEPCRDSIPHLVDLQERYQNEVRVIGLNVGGEDDLERVPAFAKRFNIQYPLGEPDADLVELLLTDSQAIPQTFVFDRRGILAKRFIGFGYYTGAELDQAVESALQSNAD